ncbi:MAG: bifunctional rhamnulose-1-phosphate aldolase/short-chain dehydrogenase [Verrucomicrobia bacterium]|nr:bifunctional rhamnulose-1-phosphate aldolase/short-chain dehydrogenase [Verrucomicrobiota bacterium]MBV8482881.1 bifunctional rhamnulose-1-phosphate aldolase/short-chain dehydrogenase [Verrucomicrobiota bacterium]
MKTRFVDYLWDDAKATALDPVERLIYRSNLLGSDQRITNTGGGNTSSKLQQTDPLTGEKVEVLWVKGSGGDLRTSKKENFSSLYLRGLERLRAVYEASPNRGLKTEVEDSMVAAYPHCTFNLNPRAASIDTPLHGFVPYPHVDHTHPNAVISLAAAKDGEKLTKEIYGEDVFWLPWQRPGFDLGLKLHAMCKQFPKAKGAILGQHGLINWADDDKECYELSLSLIERAAEYIASRDKGDKTFGGQKYSGVSDADREEMLFALLPWLRGQIGRTKRLVATLQYDENVLRFVNSHDASRLAALGTSCPDHFLRTKIQPLYVDWDPISKDVERLRSLLELGLGTYRGHYERYYRECRHDDSPPIRDPNPTVVLIPGLGLIAWGKDKSESRVTAEFYDCAIEVMRGSEATSSYIALPVQEAFDIEYWQLEEAKLRRMPPEKELARRVILVVGAGSGIGKELAHRVSGEGAQVVSADLSAEAAAETANEITKKLGEGIGVAGSGISRCGPAVGVSADITNREKTRNLLKQSVLAYGGVDDLVVTAGVFVPPDSGGRIPDEKFRFTLDVNVTGSYVVADEFAKILRDQGLQGSVVLTSSANAVVSKKGSFAYDVSKSALNHLVRELAIELAPLGRVNAVAPATVVQGSTMFPRDRVISSLSKYQVPFSEDESTDSLVNKLSRFYAERSLLREPILPKDQAEAYFLLLSGRLAKTTGQIIAVDGGLPEAFLR